MFDVCNYLCGYNMDSWGTCLTHVTFARRILYAEHEVELMCRKGGSPRWYEQCQQPLVFMLIRRCATSFCRYFGLVRRQEGSHKRIKTRVFCRMTRSVGRQGVFCWLASIAASSKANGIAVSSKVTVFFQICGKKVFRKEYMICLIVRVLLLSSRNFSFVSLSWRGRFSVHC